ncbi:MAG: hypothetical protein IPJ93_09040 [Bacteroidota bacterium]|nr:MAG: hypothetical protein IPJ93_09040 [Bacteroidota bacterium]
MTTTLKATFLSLAIIGTAFFAQAQKPVEGIAIGNKARSWHLHHQKEKLFPFHH